MKRILFSLCLLATALSSRAQEFEIRYSLIDCNTIRIQSRCVSNGNDNPDNGENSQADEFFFNIISPAGDLLDITIDAGYSGFTIVEAGGQADDIAEDGFQIYLFKNSNTVTYSGGNAWTLNSWKDICDLTIASGTANVRVAAGSDLPTTYGGAVLTTNVYTTPSDFMTVSSSVGTLIKQWTGTASTAWSTAGNWCPAGAPSNTESVQIINQTNDPILAADITIGALEIQAGALLTLSGNQLTVNGALSGTGTVVGSATSKMVFGGTTAGTLRMDQTTPGTTNLLQNITINNTGGVTLGNALRVLGIITHTAGTLTTGGNLTLGATSTTAYAQIANSGSGTISGNITMEKFLSNTNAGWRHFSLPLAGTLSGFSGIDLSYSAPVNVKFWDATLNTGKAIGWTTATAGSSRSLGGFTIFSNNSAGGAFDLTQTISHTGTYANSDLSFDLKATEDAGGSGADATGWNLVGNPFPSNLSLSSLFADIAANGSISYKAVHIWDATTGQYKAILNGVSITNYNTAGGTDGTTQILAPFQAFWMKVDADVTFSMKNSFRTTSSTNLGTFLKKNYDLARIDVFDPAGKWDQAVVYFHDDATEGFDGALDGYKMISMNDDVPSLYAVNYDGIFSISALSTNEFEHVVPMGFRSNAKGEMKFELNTTELDNKWFVYVEDKDLGIFYDIKTKPYTFDHVQNSDERFVLHFQQHPLSAEKLVDDVKTMKVSGNGEEVYVFVPNHFRDQIYEVAIYDLQGRLVYQNANTSLEKGMNTLNINLENSAIYVLRVKAAEGMVSGKVQIF